MKKLIAGNWKMNTTRAEATALAAELAKRAGAAGSPKFDMVLCPPAIWTDAVLAAVAGTALAVGAQDVHHADKGAFTGSIAAPMLHEAGVRYAIVGHSERRQYQFETNATIRAKAENAIKHGIIPIICVGEQESERAAGKQNDVVAKQLAESLPATGHFVVAYEPVWAIGTGKTATDADVAAMHAFIRTRLDHAKGAAILYGGSVKASNAAAILNTPDVGGVLVGGASLVADEFWAIASAA